VRDALRVKHYSLRTERSYCDWIERFIRFSQQTQQRRLASSTGDEIAAVSSSLT